MIHHRLPRSALWKHCPLWVTSLWPPTPPETTHSVIPFFQDTTFCRKMFAEKWLWVKKQTPTGTTVFREHAAFHFFLNVHLFGQPNQNNLLWHHKAPASACDGPKKSHWQPKAGQGWPPFWPWWMLGPVLPLKHALERQKRVVFHVSTSEISTILGRNWSKLSNFCKSAAWHQLICFTWER